MDPEREAARKRFLERADAAGAPGTSILAGRPPASSEAADRTARRILGGLRPGEQSVARLAVALEQLAEADAARPRKSRTRSRRRAGA